MLEVAKAINSFLPTKQQADFVPPSDQLITLTYGQLQDLIKEAVKEAIAPLQERLDRLEALEEIYHGPAPQVEEIPMYRDAFEKKRAALDGLPSRVWGIEQDLSELEKTSTKQKAAEPTQKTLAHLNQIAAILLNREQSLINSEAPRAYIGRLRHEGLTFSQLANIMELTVDRIRQLSRIAATDQRFNVSWHPKKKNTKIIKLRQWDIQGI